MSSEEWGEVCLQFLSYVVDKCEIMAMIKARVMLILSQEKLPKHLWSGHPHISSLTAAF